MLLCGRKLNIFIIGAVYGTVGDTAAEMGCGEFDCQIDTFFLERQFFKSCSIVGETFADFVKNAARRNFTVKTDENFIIGHCFADGFAVDEHFCQSQGRAVIAGLRLNTDAVAEVDFFADYCAETVVCELGN